MIVLLRDLITNFAIITVFVLFVEQFFILTKLDQRPTWYYKVYVGLTHGILVVILVSFGITVDGHIGLNFRGVGFLLAAYLGGYPSILITFFILSIWRFAIEHSIQLPIFLIGLAAVIGTNFTFSKMRTYWSKWLFGGAFLYVFYYGMMWVVYRTSLQVIGTYLTYQMVCVVVVACFLGYLIRAREYKLQIRQVEQELIDMLRLQPGFTFKFHKHRGHFVYILIEGQLLYQLGLRPSQFIGKRAQEISILGTKYLEFLQPYYEQAWAGERVSYEYDCQGFTILVTLQPIFKFGAVSEVIGSAVDVSEHRAAQMKARVRDEQFRTLVENSEDFILRFRLDGSVASANSKMYQTYQLTPDQVKGKQLTDVIHMDNPSKWERSFNQSIINGKTQQFAINFLQPDGAEHTYNVTLSPLFNETRTEIIAVTGTVHDITDLKKREEADESNRAKSQFLARMSHEIRTPLNGILGLSLLLQRTELTPLQKDYLSKMDASSSVLLATINDILDFSKIEAGKLILEKVDFSLEESLQKVADLVSVSLGNKRIEILLDTSEDLPDIVSGDSFRLEQVLINLSNNAIKFTEQGHIRLQVQLEEYAEEGIIISFAVEDTGIGISKEQLSQLFLPFSQADTSTSRRYGGTGLGLVICQHLVQSMGGVLRVETTLGAGSRFYFSLLFGRNQQTEGDMYFAYRQHLLPQENKQVLVAEDHPIAARHVSELLGSFQLEAKTVLSVSDLLAALEQGEGVAGQAAFRYIFLDMQMDPMQHQAIWQRVLNAVDRSRTHVIALTTLEGREEMCELPEALKADAVLVKPVSRLSLRKVLQVLSGQKPSPKRYDRDKEQAMAEGAFFQSKGHILVAEDNEINQLVITQLLQQLGYEAVIAQNGYEVLERVGQQDWKLILMDIHMPEMDGYEATQKLRQLKAMQRIPIIALTANGFVKDSIQMLKLGLNGILVKPVNEKQLADMLEKWQDLQWLLHIKGMDPERVLRNIDQKVHIFQYMIEKFKQDYACFTEKLLPPIIHQEDAVARRMVHTLKGVAANFYAESLLAAVLVLEKEMEQEINLETCKEGIVRVQLEIDRIVATI
ncbi:response regulator [Paenibacillus chondroitinus]|uniref:histidine kinase n=1 Tax=Paenibacillus chondroitinus TaxID=59842 RepID=A0ABU6D451_9BACL|nr:response regulator [Paenibacillus chondroitinus]MCY9661251.1 response regulator [Paenibacillus anseongense]MEB4792505.1 response regulator [Paenibacillus chondroitinus]